MADRRTVYLILSWTVFACVWSNQLESSYTDVMKSVEILGQTADIDASQILNSPNGDSIELFSKLSRMLAPETRMGLASSLDEALRRIKATPQYDVSDTCLTQIELVVKGLVAQHSSSMRMVDAMGKIPSGLLDLNLHWFGSFDECTNVTIAEFQGKYCTVNFPLGAAPAGMAAMGALPGVNIGLCVPSSCSSQDVTIFVNTVVANISANQITGNLSLNASMSICQELDLEWDTKAIVVLVITSMFVVLMLVATAYDFLCVQWPKHKIREYEALNNGLPTYAHKIKVDVDEVQPLLGGAHTDVIQGPGFLGQALLAFSMYTNGCKILSTHQGAGSITSLNGVRFLSMSWVLLGHTFVFGLGVGENLLPYMTGFLKRWSGQAIVNALVSVDSFFTISGLLLSYLVLKEMKKGNGKLNWGMYYFHRFWRLTPPYMLLMMVYVPLLRYTRDGPVWPQGGTDVNCDDNWWLNLLYVNNFVNEEKMCMGWSWYLANDMQFYVVSPLMLIPLYFSPVIGIGMCGLFLLAVLITAGVISSVNDMPPTMFGGGGTTAGTMTYFNDYYIKPYCRMGPYIIGIMTGYVLYRTNCQCRINKYVNLFCWLLAIGASFAVVYGLHDAINGHPLSVDVSALYNTTNRVVWGMSLCWIIFACATGNGGFVNAILSWKVFIPLSRLTYCGYLVHPIIMSAFYLSVRSPLHFDDFTMVMYFLGFMMLSYASAFIISLAFEAPFMGLEKVIFKRERSEKK